MQIERKIEITYRWWNNENKKKPIDKKHAEALEESAKERIMKMMKEGMTAGELHDNIFMHDTDPEDGVEYQGWFEIKETNIE